MRLPPAARRELLAALVLLTALPPALRALGYGRTRAFLARLGGAVRPDAGMRPAAAVERARAHRRRIDGVAARLPWRPRCLARALAVWTLTRRDGLPTALRLGVRPAGAGIEAHAWVECGGVALEPADAWSALPGR